MTRTVAELAEYLGAQIVGNSDGSRPITGVAAVETAQTGDLTFVTNPKYAGHIKSTKASAVLVQAKDNGAGIWDDINRPELTFLAHKEPYHALMRAISLYHPPPPPPVPGIDRSARVGQRVKLADGAHVGPHCVIEDDAVLGEGSVVLAGSFVGARSKFGAQCTIGPNTTVLHDCALGDRVRIFPGTVVGGDGFGFVPTDGRYEKIPQVGGVSIGDDVEIGSCCTVDRATLAQTVIGRGTKIDNLVMIAHNVTIGEDCVIVSQVGVSGSTHIGNHVTIAGQVGIVGHVEIGDNAIVMAQAGVSKDIPAGATVLGAPARDVGLQKRIFAVEGSLPDHVKTIKQLVKRVEELERRLGKNTGSK